MPVPSGDRSASLNIRQRPSFLARSTATKSVHMRMVHSVSRGEGISPDHTLHRRGDRGVVIDVRQFVWPRAIHIEMLGHIGYQVLQACAGVIAGAEVMHIAKGALDRVGPGTIGRSKEQPYAQVFG